MNTTFTKLTAALALLFAAGSLTAGEKSSLDGKWRLDYWPQGDTPIVSPADARQVGMKTIDATVPGNVELDLLAAFQRRMLSGLRRGDGPRCPRGGGAG